MLGQASKLEEAEKLEALLTARCHTHARTHIHTQKQASLAKLRCFTAVMVYCLVVRQC